MCTYICIDGSVNASVLVCPFAVEPLVEPLVTRETKVRGMSVTVIVMRLVAGVQAVVGKFRAPSPYVPNPFQSTLNPTGTVVGGGSVWH